MSVSQQPRPNQHPDRTWVGEDNEEKDAETKEQEEEEVPTEGVQHPLLRLSTSLFLLSLPTELVPESERAQLKADIDQQVQKDNMAAFYAYLGESHGWQVDASKLSAMKSANQSALESAAAKIEEAKEVAGDTEVREAMWHQASLYANWGDKKKADEEMELVFDKTVGVASKIDVLLARMRVALTFNDLKGYKQDLDRAKILVEQGGDWERKNQLSVYESLYLLLTRQFSDASKLLLDSVSTFTTTELFDYRTFVLYTCLLALLHVDRATLQKDILKSPEILSVLDDIPHLRQLLTSLYKCNYKEFFVALAGITPSIERARYLAPHTKYYLRELRVVAYTQFLSSYKAASLQAMAEAFGVSVSFLDRELFRFISGGRLHAKIDSVSSVVDTTRPDQRNQSYQQLLKEGDKLLNRISKMSKVVAM